MGLAGWRCVLVPKLAGEYCLCGARADEAGPRLTLYLMLELLTSDWQHAQWVYAVTYAVPLQFWEAVVLVVRACHALLRVGLDARAHGRPAWRPARERHPQVVVVLETGGLGLPYRSNVVGMD